MSTIQYLIMSSRFNNKCNETKSPIVKGQECFYVPSERRAYLRSSQKAAWLILNGSLKGAAVPEVVKPEVVTVPEVVKPEVVTVPAMAFSLNADRPAFLPSRKRQAPRSESIIEKHPDGSTSVLTVYYPRLK